MRSLPLPFATGRKFDTFIALSHYALIANPIIPKNLKIFVPHQFSVEFMSKKADKLQKILVLHPKIRNQRLNDHILPGKHILLLFFLNFFVQLSLLLKVSVVCK